jgi:cytochrome b involved in lipid metabolism
MNRDDSEKPEVGNISCDEVAKHNSRDSCWVIVHGKAYDVTEFLPGMQRSIVRKNPN